MISERTKAALASKKSSGHKLGNTRNIASAGVLGRSVQTAAANQFVAGVLPLVQSIRNPGATTLEAMTVLSTGAASARRGADDGRHEIEGLNSR